MRLTRELRRELQKTSRILKKAKEDLRKECNISMGDTMDPAPAGYVETDPERHMVFDQWRKKIGKKFTDFEKLVLTILKNAPATSPDEQVKLDESNLWLWGGPTPSWGGSTAKDSLIQGANYFNIKNGVYVYGSTNKEMIELHKNFNKLLCQINKNCRTEEIQNELTEEENAGLLSLLSTEYPNITGAMCDDMTNNIQANILPDEFIPRYNALKKHNEKLKMYGTVYVHELGKKDFSIIQPYVDVITLWFWSMDEIIDYDENIRKCQKDFPGKKILQGVFIHDYGLSECGAIPELLAYQLDRARKYIKDGILEGVVILGDREIKKWPHTAAAVKKYLEKQ